MEKQDIINYVLETPTNTNPAVLSGMLDSIGGGGSDDVGIAKMTVTISNGAALQIIRIGNGGGPDARMIPLAYDGYSAFRGSSTVYYYGASKVYELEIRINSSSCNVTGRAI